MPLATVIYRLSSEMHCLSGQVTRLETAVPHTIQSDPKMMDRQAVYALQEFDTLIQSLEALSKFLKQLAEVLPPEQMIDVQAALDAVHLGSVANRLSGHISEGLGDAAPDTELF